MAGNDRPTWYLPGERKPLPAGGERPKGVAYWCREGDTFWHRIDRTLESPEPRPEELPDYVQFHPEPW